MQNSYLQGKSFCTEINCFTLALKNTLSCPNTSELFDHSHICPMRSGLSRHIRGADSACLEPPLIEHSHSRPPWPLINHSRPPWPLVEGSHSRPPWGLNRMENMTHSHNR